MKILVVSNLYPPHFIGGYELGCRDVVEGLRARGHTVQVLTGDFQNAGGTEPEATEVRRILKFETKAKGSIRDHLAECRKLTATLREFSPDLVYFWNQGGLCLWLSLAARWRGQRVVFFLSDTNFTSWRVGAWLSGRAQKNAVLRFLFGKTFLVRGWPILKGAPCHFASEFLKGVAVKSQIPFAEKHSIVARWGIEAARFASSLPRLRWPPKRLLYVGQMIPQKGVHTAIAAFAKLSREKIFADATLTLVGGGRNADYEKHLRELPGKLNIAGSVHFHGKISPEALPQIYAESDVLIFPSEWDEPFAITPLEAMATGLAVVGTTTGGSGELLRDRETAMTFRAGDAGDCVRALRELGEHRALFEKIARAGRQEVLKDHTMGVFLDRLEKSLTKISTGVD